MRDDGYCSDSDAAPVGRRQRRRDQSCRSFTCVSPWDILSRWFGGGSSRGPKVVANLGVKRRHAMVDGSIDLRAASSFSAENSEEVEKEDVCKLGAGIDLLCLIAASRNELSKMVDLHQQMEIMLHNLRTEFRNTEENKKLSNAHMAQSFLNSNHVQERSYLEKKVANTCLSARSFRIPEISFSNCPDRFENCVRMDKIEDELVSELDRLQLQIDAEVFSKYSKQLQFEINVESSAPEMSLTTSFEEISEQPDEFSSQDHFYGVDPRELERRLYELLEQRQQDEIRGLESALEQSAQQLEIKERELSWWKHNASLSSPNLKEPTSHGTEQEL